MHAICFIMYKNILILFSIDLLSLNLILYHCEYCTNLRWICHTFPIMIIIKQYIGYSITIFVSVGIIFCLVCYFGLPVANLVIGKYIFLSYEKPIPSIKFINIITTNKSGNTDLAYNLVFIISLFQLYKYAIK